MIALDLVVRFRRSSVTVRSEGIDWGFLIFFFFFVFLYMNLDWDFVN